MNLSPELDELHQIILLYPLLLRLDHLGPIPHLYLPQLNNLAANRLSGDVQGLRESVIELYDLVDNVLAPLEQLVYFCLEHLQVQDGVD